MQRFALAIIIASCAAAAGDTLIVPDEYTNIQDAVNVAARGDIVLVRPGVYEGDLDFLDKSISLIGEQGPEFTRIESLNSTSPPASVTLLSDETVVIEGFTIVQGRYLHPALLIRGGNAVIRDCDFPTVNAVAAIDSGDAVVLLERCRIWNKQIAIRATATRLTLRDCEISDGLGAVPPGIWTNGPYTELDGCVFRNNRVLAASFLPGGAVAQSSGELVARDCCFEFNSATFGGAIALNCEAQFTRCRFSSNLAHTIGGAIFSVGNAHVTLRDCIFEINDAIQGGAMGIQHDASVEAINSVFVENQARTSGALAAVADRARLSLVSCSANHPDLPAPVRALDVGEEAHLSVVNSVLWGTSQQLGDDGEQMVSFSNVYGGADGTGNFSAPPMFSDFELRLIAASPCIDVGDNTAVLDIAQDRDGCPRVVGGVVDVGAHEWRCPGDLDGDSAGSMADVEILLSRFGKSGRRCDGDINGDGFVDLSDLGAMLASGCFVPLN